MEPVKSVGERGIELLKEYIDTEYNGTAWRGWHAKVRALVNEVDNLRQVEDVETEMARLAQEIRDLESKRNQLVFRRRQEAVRLETLRRGASHS